MEPIIAALIEVNPETGAAVWSPVSIVVPVLQVAAVAITAALGFYLLVMALPVIFRLVVKVELAAIGERFFGRGSR